MKSRILAAITATLTLNTSSTFAAIDMEKCKVVKDGRGLIKEHKSDCASLSHSCSGQNKAGDTEAWIFVPKGQCQKINAGDFSEIDQDILDKIEIESAK